MRQHSFASHTPEENRHLSNIGHIAEGITFVIVALFAFLDGVGNAAWAAKAWPILLLCAGVVLLVLIYPRHPASDWPAIWRDMQQRQHTIMAVAVAAASAAELFRGSIQVLAYVWPGAAILIGRMFLIHEQHGTSQAAANAVRQHRILGLTLIAAGLLRAGEVSTGNALLAIAWPVALFGAALQMLYYREPDGAFETHHGPGHHAQ